jgi:histidyl-tRNA synthetase
MQTGPVWRAERPQKGRFRQFTQCDIDVIGEAGPIAEAELILATWAAFEALGLAQKATVLINDRHVLTDLLGAAGVKDGAIPGVLIALDKIDKIGKEAVIEQASEHTQTPPDVIARLMDVLDEVRQYDDLTVEPLVRGHITAGNVQLSLGNLPAISQAVMSVNPHVSLRFDASLVRGMGYYTGPIFEIIHEDSGSSVAGGGRYDGVVGKWLGTDVPACGLSIGFERIIDLVSDGSAQTERVAVLYSAASDIGQVLAARAQLVKNGVDTGLVRLPRRVTGAFFEQLSARDFTHVMDIERDSAPRPLN